VFQEGRVRGPAVFPLGPMLLAGWLATVIAFVMVVK
jgi:hypothetical protein